MTSPASVSIAALRSPHLDGQWFTFMIFTGSDMLLAGIRALPHLPEMPQLGESSQVFPYALITHGRSVSSRKSGRGGAFAAFPQGFAKGLVKVGAKITPRVFGARGGRGWGRSFWRTRFSRVVLYFINRDQLKRACIRLCAVIKHDRFSNENAPKCSGGRG